MSPLNIFNRIEPTPEQRTRLDRVKNSRHRKTILAAIRAGKTIPESVWAPLPEGADIGRLIVSENMKVSCDRSETAAPVASRNSTMPDPRSQAKKSGSTFELWTHPEETSLDQVGQKEGLKTLFGWGIVNPFGPTLTVVATDGILYVTGRKLPIVYLMLHPFQQEVRIVGEASIGQGWDSFRDLLPLLDVRLGGCPTLLLPSAFREPAEDIEFYAKLLSRFDDGSSVLKKVRRFPGDPWNRVKEEMDASVQIMIDGLQRMKEVNQGTQPTILGKRLLPDEARELATTLLQPKNFHAEIQAFLYAWKGSIELQASQGARFLSDQALSEEDFRKLLMQLLCSCRLPERDA
jgi:hypothetical protein